MNPINYDIEVKSPFDSSLKGFVAGNEVAGVMQKQQLQDLALSQQRQMQADLASFVQKPNPGAQDYAALMTRYPSMAEHFKKSWDVLNVDQQQNKLQQATQVYSAMNAGRADVAMDLLTRQATALRNAGNEQEAKHAETMAQFIEMDPKSAKASTSLMLASILGPEKFATTFETLGKEDRANAEAPYNVAIKKGEAQVKTAEGAVAPSKVQADIDNVVSQTVERSARLGLDREKLATEIKLKLTELNQKATTLDDSTRKVLNDATTASIAADQSSLQMLSLADRLEQESARSGVTAKGAELYKQVTGNQDGVTALRQEYTRLRSSAVLKMLPPGPASDKDIAFAMKGFPEDTADPKAMASFLRGMGKIQQRESAAESAKAEWVNAVGHLGKPKADIEIEGIKVPAGTSYVEFTRQFLDKRTAARASEQKAQQLQGRSYMKWAQPAGMPLGSGLYGAQ
jgi:hypothetical protein